MNEQEITNYVLSLIPKEEKDRVFKQEYCAIGTDFIGFMETYYYLSKIIPKEYTVYDFGCALIKACLNEICNFSEEEKELLEGKLISAKNFKEIIKHTIIEIEEDGFHAIYDDWDIKYKFATGDMKYPNYNEVISQFKPGFAEKVLIDPLNIELIADALNERRGIRFHFPKDDSKGIKITFFDKELSLSEALLMPKLDY